MKRYFMFTLIHFDVSLPKPQSETKLVISYSHIFYKGKRKFRVKWT